MKISLAFWHNTTTILLGLVLGLVGTAGCYGWEQRAQTDGGAHVIYFVPQDSNRVEANLTEPILFAASDLRVRSTSDWQVVDELSRRRQLDAIVIHHAASENIDVEQVRGWYRNGIVIAGIGIPAKEMAELLGMPELNIWGEQETFKTPFYFYIFSLKIEASEEDKQKIISALEKRGLDEPASNIHGQSSTHSRKSTDSLLTVEGKERFPSVLQEHIDDVTK